jgi:hypothetical protein
LWPESSSRISARLGGVAGRERLVDLTTEPQPAELHGLGLRSFLIKPVLTGDVFDRERIAPLAGARDALGRKAVEGNGGRLQIEAGPPAELHPLRLHLSSLS